jgi:hypothetical protein
VRIETLVLHVKKYRIFEVSEKMVRASVWENEKKQLLFWLLELSGKMTKKWCPYVALGNKTHASTHERQGCSQ